MTTAPEAISESDQRLIDLIGPEAAAKLLAYKGEARREQIARAVRRDEEENADFYRELESR